MGSLLGMKKVGSNDPTLCLQMLNLRIYPI